MPSEVKAVVTKEGNTVLKGKGHAGHDVQIDYIPPFGGDDGIMPLELLLISLAACSCHTVLFLLRKMGKDAAGFTIHATGQRRDEHPTVFTGIELHLELSGDNLDAPTVEKTIRMAEEKLCPVWAMLKGNVPVTWKYALNA